MAWELGLDAVYYLIATLFQLSLAVLILSTGPKKPVRIAFSLLLGLGGIQTAHFFLDTSLSAPFPDPTNRVVDTWILLTIAYLALQFPTSLGGERGERWTRRAWLAALGVVLVSFVGSYPTDPELYQALRSNVHEVSYALGAGAIAVHLVPRWLELGRGPLKTQTLYAGAGLAMSAAFFTGLRVDNYLALGTIAEKILSGPSAASHVLVVFFMLIVLARIALAYWRDRDGETLALASLLGGAALLAAWTQVAALEGTSEFATQVGRPILFALAMLRFDLFRVPLRIRRVALPVTAVFLASLSFLVLTSLLDPGGMRTQQVDPVSALAATTILAAGVVVGHGWFREAFLAPLGEEETAEGRIDRYRLAMERARAQGENGHRLDELRRRLGITEREHDVLEHLLDEHVVLPTTAVRGAASGDVIGGRYEVERELGRGGAGRALAAWDTVEERTVVLKEILRPWEEGADDRRRTLEREAEVASDLEHGCLASVIDLVDTTTRLYLVREYVPGSTLDEIVDEEGAMPVSRVRQIGVQLAQALDALHEQGLFHLDLKPGNVVLDDHGRPVLIDHGTIQVRSGLDEEGSDRTHKTQTLSASSTQKGTLAWMAPEQVLDEGVDERTDVFALGALLYHLATGRMHVDVEDASRFAIEDAIVHGQPPSDVPGPLREVVVRALSRNPDQRWRSAEAMADALREPRPAALAAEDQQAEPDAHDVAG